MKKLWESIVHSTRSTSRRRVPFTRFIPALEPLGRRILPTTYVSSGDIYVQATNGPDVVNVTDDSFSFHITENGNVTSIPKSEVYHGKLYFFGYEGNDWFANDGNKLYVIADGMGGHDTLKNTGTSLAAFHNEFYGGDGDDVLDVVGSDNIHILYGGVGNDTLYMNDVGNFLYGDAGDDLLIGGAGLDRLHGGAGNDRLFGRSNIDFLHGDAGNDRAFGEIGDDTIEGGDGDDVLGGAFETSSAENGKDLIRGGNGHDWLYGGSGDDKLYGDYGHDRLYGQDGFDYLSAGYSYEWNSLSGGNGNDTLQGGYGDDYLYGDAGDDILRGYNGNDELNGGSGIDYLYGEAGTDDLNGGSDTVTDYLYGGTGADWFKFSAYDYYPDFTSQDEIY